MSAVKTSLRASDLPESLKALRDDFEWGVPVGFNSHQHTPFRRQLPWGALETKVADHMAEFKSLDTKVQKLSDKASHQVGSLGGGNHFIELCLDEQDFVWIMLHSGSRNIGKMLADIHIAEAKTLAHNVDIPDPNLAVFLGKTPEMLAYRHDLTWAQEYARLNRQVMMTILLFSLEKKIKPFETLFVVQCHHNYVSEEVHFGENVLVTRKGAISAKQEEYGIIPGSMGTGSFIVRGLGNVYSFCSASHGAGRKMSRGQAKRTFTEDDLIAQTMGVECRKDVGILDEIPGAYKDLGVVLEQQKDCVEVVHKLRTILCVKG